MSEKIIKLVHDNKEIDNANYLVNDIKELVYSYAGKMSTAAAFGCIEIAKFELQKEVFEDE